MREYDRQQKNQLSRAIANNEPRGGQLKRFNDNRFNNKVILKTIQREDNDNVLSSPIDNILKKISKEELLEIMKFRVTEVGNELLAQINQTTNDCPYIRKWFTYYGEKDMFSITQAISRFAPLSNNASSLDEYVDSVIDRIRIGLQKHIDTGTVEDIPSEIMNENRKPADFVHIAQKEANVSQMSMCCCKDSTTTDAENISAPILKEPNKDESKSSISNSQSFDFDRRYLIPLDHKTGIEQFEYQGLLYKDQIPKDALEYAHERLMAAVRNASLVETVIDVEKVKESVKKKINLMQGALKGPSQNAINTLDSYLNKAITNKYNLLDENVQEQFAYFLLALVTEGYKDKETTGTQMGNFLGSWRGGGF